MYVNININNFLSLILVQMAVPKHFIKTLEQYIKKPVQLWPNRDV